METYLDDHEVIEALKADLQSVSKTVSIEMIKTNEKGDIVNQLVSVDLAPLTEKQREALRIAIRGRYYERGSGVTLTDLAAELGVSAQAFGQRLDAAEEKIMSQLSA